MRALEKEPGERFQSADAFIAALDAALREPGGRRRHGVLRAAAAGGRGAELEADPEEEETQAPLALGRRRSPRRS